MLTRLSANVLIKSVIAAIAVMVIVVLAADGWNSWQRLGSASRISLIADASSFVFKAMSNLRLDRSFTERSLGRAESVPAEQKMIKQSRDEAMPALQAAIDEIGRADVADAATLAADLRRKVDALAALQPESWEAMNKPKAATPVT